MKVNLTRTNNLCDLYWNKLRNSGQLSKNTVSSLKHKLEIYDVNNLLIGANNDVSKRIVNNITKIIRDTDIDFRCIKVTKENMTIWRGLRRPIDKESVKKYYEKNLNLKQGDKIRMPGYIYATSDRDEAEMYGNIKLNHFGGILYKINVPPDSPIYQSGAGTFIFPRNSEFLCTNSIAINDANYSHQLICLDYIIPKWKF